VLLIFLILRFYLLILLHQRAAIAEPRDEAIVAVVTLDVILAAYIASADRLANSLERAEREGATAHTLTEEVRKEYVHYRYKTKHQSCHPYEPAFYRKEYMGIR